MPAPRLAVGAGLAALAFASPAVGVPAPVPAPYAGVYQPHGVDEIGMWQEDDESERKLAASPLVIRDEKLTSYVKGVLCEAVGHDRCNAARVYILREPTFNATMSPNGTMRVYSGLLLRTRSEAELAAVLGHEFGHFEKRHGVNSFKSARGATNVLAWAQVLASMSSSYDVRRSYQNLELSVYGSFFRYKRDQEREADLTGLGYLNASNLRPQAASVVWQNVMGEAEASARVRGLKKPNFNALAFTASHAPNAERAAYLFSLALPEGAMREDGTDRYRAALKPWISQFLQEQIKLNDFGGSDYLIERLAEGGWTADLWLARGELFRTRGNQRDLANAADFYGKAIAADTNLASAYRGLGLSLLKLGRDVEGREALRTYLALSPDASDAGMIKLMVPGETAQ
jgi:beta-barrel assembly-enhancing protease